MSVNVATAPLKVGLGGGGDGDPLPGQMVGVGNRYRAAHRRGRLLQRLREG